VLPVRFNHPAMSGLLEKIWLGNVNEQGEVDQEYDQETKSGLTIATSKNKDVSLPDSLAVSLEAARTPPLERGGRTRMSTDSQGFSLTVFVCVHVRLCVCVCPCVFVCVFVCV